jgi:hypothetical protein
MTLKGIVDVAAQRSDPELNQWSLQAQTQLNEFIQPNAEFSAMTRGYLGM